MAPASGAGYLFSSRPAARALRIVPTAPRQHSALEHLAREIHALFPTCVRCGARIERFEDAEVRIFRFRVFHRKGCERGEASSER